MSPNSSIPTNRVFTAWVSGSSLVPAPVPSSVPPGVEVKPGAAVDYLYDLAVRRLFPVGMAVQALASLDGDDLLVQRAHAVVDEIDHIIGDIRRFLTAPSGSPTLQDNAARPEVASPAGATSAWFGARGDR